MLCALAAAGLARDNADGATARVSAKAATKLVTGTTTTLSQADDSPRLEVRCPKDKFPYGGGMTATPPPGAGGEGVYPHSFERLGLQRGFHVTPVLFDPAAPTEARSVTLQVVCGPDPGKVASPRALVQVSPGQTLTAVATCPSGRQLFAGGFQQTNFTSTRGAFATQSQAVGNNAWSVTASAFGPAGGQAGAIAYCVKGKSSFQEVSASAAIPPGGNGTATTPPCPGGKRLVAGGFATNPAGAVFFGNGTINVDQSFSASGYNRSGAPATISGYAYCRKVTVPKKKKKKK